MSATLLRNAKLSLVASTPPPCDTAWSARSLRSAAISAAHSIGVPLPAITRISNRASEVGIYRHYLDALLPPCDAALLFFGRFTS